MVNERGLQGAKEVEGTKIRRTRKKKTEMPRGGVSVEENESLKMKREKKFGKEPYQQGEDGLTRMTNNYEK